MTEPIFNIVKEQIWKIFAVHMKPKYSMVVYVRKDNAG